MREPDPVPLRIAGEAAPGVGVRDVHSPFHGERVARVAVAGEAELDAAIAGAAAAAPAMRSMPAYARAEALARAAAALRRDAARFVALIVGEGGKPVRYARGEVERAERTLAACAEEATRLHGAAPALDGAPQGAGRSATVRLHPLGVVAAITPFNFPLNLAVHKVGPALAAGNAVVWKPSERVPATGLLLGALLDGCGFPPGAVNVVVGTSPALGERLARDERPAALSFTGSPAVGWALRALCGRKRLTLELGGNAAVVVDRSADLEDAARRVTEAAYAHAGQICISAQRVFVHADVAARFRDALVEAIARDARPGDPADPATMVGPLITAEAADRVEAWVAAAEAAGARVTRWGKRAANVLPPMLVEGAPASAAVHRREVFGPVLTLDPVGSLAEGLARADDTEFGLQASLFTKDLDAVAEAEARLTVGALIVNDAPTFRVDTMPYGGERASGLGREGVAEAVRAFTRPLLTVVRRQR